MDDRQLQSLRQGTYDGNSTLIVPLDEVKPVDSDVKRSRVHKDGGCFFYHSKTILIPPLAPQKNGTTSRHKHSSITLTVRGDAITFDVHYLRQTDSILAKLDDPSRQNPNHNHKIVKDVENKLRSVPGIFKGPIPNALHTFRHWTMTGKYDPRAITSVDEYYAFRLQAACVLTGHILKSPKFLGLAIREIEHAFVQPDEIPVTITNGDVQLCHAVAPLLNGTLVSLLKKARATSNKSFESLRLSHDKIHPNSWNRIGLAEDGSKSKAATSMQAKKSMTPVSGRALANATARDLPTAQDSTSHSPDSKDNGIGGEDDVQVASPSRKSTVTSPATTTSRPVELSQTPTIPVSPIGWQKEQLSEDTDVKTNAPGDSKESKELAKTIASPSKWQVLEPESSKPVTPELPDAAAGTEGVLSKALQNEITQSTEANKENVEIADPNVGTGNHDREPGETPTVVQDAASTSHLTQLKLATTGADAAVPKKPPKRPALDTLFVKKKKPVYRPLSTTRPTNEKKPTVESTGGNIFEMEPGKTQEGSIGLADPKWLHQIKDNTIARRRSDQKVRYAEKKAKERMEKEIYGA